MRYIPNGRHSRSIGWALVSVLWMGGAMAQESSTLRIAIPSDIESMDPHLSGGLSMRVWANVYETLLSRDADGNLKPGLAESWKRLDDTHYEFKIRDGVTFSTGRPVDAPAIAQSFNAKNSPASPHTHISFSRWIKRVEATDASTLVVETDGPFPAALFYLAGVMPASIYDTEAREEWGDLKTRSAGSGPFELDSIRPGTSIILSRNDNYWGGKPKLETLQFQVIPEEITRVLALQRGEVDMTLDLSPASLQRLQGSSDLDVSVSRALRLNTIEFNFLRPLIAENPAVRKAIMLGIDTKLIVENVIGAMGDPADSIVLDISSGYTQVPEFLEYDPERAKAILDDAGWKPGPDGVRSKDGQKLELILVTDFTRDYRNREVAQAVQSYLSEIGIKIDLKILERGPFVDAVVQKGEGYDLAIQGWGSPTNEASWWIYTRLHSSNQELGAWGTTRNRDPGFDALIDEARFELDEAVAAGKWAAIQRKVYEDAIMIPLYFSNRISAVRKNVKGLEPHPDEWYGYRFVDVDVE